MTAERELALKYLPVFMLDEKEPFDMKAVGYTIFRSDLRSDSFPKRVIAADWEKTDCVIEYEIWFDYDIQHLYELEHVWVYVGKDGGVQKAEGSFHGKYLNQVNLDTGKPPLDENGRVCVYLQPGKHAVLSDPRLVRLVPQWQESCGELAGLDGVPLPEMFQDVMAVPDEAAQEMVHRYIRKKFSFEPSLRFVPFFPETSLPEKELLLPWPELKASVPKRLQKELCRIAEAEKSGKG